MLIVVVKNAGNPFEASFPDFDNTVLQAGGDYIANGFDEIR